MEMYERINESLRGGTLRLGSVHTCIIGKTEFFMLSVFTHFSLTKMNIKNDFE